jgi:hypothetical protein
VRLLTLAERPDLLEASWRMPNAWPAFMLEDPVPNRHFGEVVDRYPALNLLGLEDGPAGEELVAVLHVGAFAWDGDPASLPARGFDAVVERTVDEARAGIAPTAACLLEAVVRPDRQGGGRSRDLVVAARAAAAVHGFAHLLAPIRPTGKADEPRRAIAEYAARTRPDGQPEDPWLRVHTRLGARVVGVCPLSMTVSGTLAQWREWTGLPFDRDGEVVVDGALAPVHVDLANDHAVYVEPNLWVHHRLDG